MKREDPTSLLPSNTGIIVSHLISQYSFRHSTAPMVCPHVLTTVSLKAWQPTIMWRDGRGGLCRNGGVSSRCSYLCCQISPARLKVQHCKKKKKKGLWQEIQRRQRYGVSNEGVPRQTGFSQTGGPENDVGRPGEIHGAAAGRLRSLRDSLVSWPGEGAHGSRQTDEERVAEFVISWFLGPFSPIIL